MEGGTIWKVERQRLAYTPKNSPHHHSQLSEIISRTLLQIYMMKSHKKSAAENKKKQKTELLMAFLMIHDLIFYILLSRISTYSIQRKDEFLRR
jgi:hypothetical protein